NFAQPVERDSLGHSRFLVMDRSVAVTPLVKFAVLLQTRDPQTRHSAALDGPLPTNELLHRQLISRKGFIKRQEPASDRRNDFCFPSGCPTALARLREIFER